MLRAYAYVDGSDLDEIGDQLAEVFANFLPAWGISSARLVNDKSPRTPDLRGDDLPDWSLGLNFETERLSLAEFDQLILFFIPDSRADTAGIRHRWVWAFIPVRRGLGVYRHARRTA